MHAVEVLMLLGSVSSHASAHFKSETDGTSPSEVGEYTESDSKARSPAPHLVP